MVLQSEWRKKRMTAGKNNNLVKHMENVVMDKM